MHAPPTHPPARRPAHKAACKALATDLANTVDPEAQFARGKALWDSRGQQPAIACEAATWFRLAAGQGHAGGQHYFALCQHSGDGVVAKNTQRAVQLLQAACDQGFTEAQGMLGMLYLQGSIPDLAPDLERGEALLLQAYAKGHAEAGAGLATACFLKNKGAPDVEAAARYLAEAERRNSSTAAAVRAGLQSLVPALKR